MRSEWATVIIGQFFNCWKVMRDQILLQVCVMIADAMHAEGDLRRQRLVNHDCIILAIQLSSLSSVMGVIFAR